MAKLTGYKHNSQEKEEDDTSFYDFSASFRALVLLYIEKKAKVQRTEQGAILSIEDRNFYVQPNRKTRPEIDCSFTVNFLF